MSNEQSQQTDHEKWLAERSKKTGVLEIICGYMCLNYALNELRFAHAHMLTAANETTEFKATVRSINLKIDALNVALTDLQVNMVKPLVDDLKHLVEK